MIDPARYHYYAACPALFRKDLVIEAQGRRKPLGQVLEPWQASDFAAADGGWLQAVGRGKGEAIKRLYLERPRGHSKTSDIAVMCAWAMTFCKKPLRGYAAAASRWQAGLLRNAIHKVLSLNPWLRTVLKADRNTIRNIGVHHPGEGGTLEILSSESGTSYGPEPDFVICDELTQWGDGDGSELWNSLLSSAGKKSTCILVIISNAGGMMGDSWQWKVRELARVEKGWHFSTLDGPQASWISEADLDEQRLFLSGKAFQRLWLNQWTQGGDALDGTDIEGCITLDAPFESGVFGCDYVAGLDLGVKRDHAAFVVLAADRREHRVRLVDCRSWKPIMIPGEKEKKVDLIAVQEYVEESVAEHKIKMVHYDPAEAGLMAQQLTRAGVPMDEKRFVAKNLDEMASALLQAVRSRSLDLYRDKELIHDLLRLNIVQKKFGFKLEAARDQTTGHADRAIALAIALPDALEKSQWKRRSVRLPVGRSGAGKR